MNEPLAALALILHLAGAQPFYQPIPPGMTCQEAGEAWLKRVRFRSPNDHFECVRVER